jgi:hypothetical protein
MKAVAEFSLDERTQDELIKLWPAYRVRSHAALVRRALALSLIAARFARPDGTVDIIDGTGTRRTVALRG